MDFRQVYTPGREFLTSNFVLPRSYYLSSFALVFGMSDVSDLLSSLTDTSAFWILGVLDPICS